MKSDKFAKIILNSPKAKKQQADHTPLKIAYGTLQDYLQKASELYAADREAWFDSFLEDPTLPEKTRKWEKSTRRLARWIGAWFHANSNEAEEQQVVLDLLDRITKDSAIREQNLWDYIAKKKSSPELSAEDLKRLEKIEESADEFLCSAIKTQNHYTDLFEKGDSYTSLQLETERKVAEQLEKIARKIPEGKLFKQASIFPPHRIPVEQPVPFYPEVYNRIHWMDPEDLDYDETTGELLPKKGYVSEDGLVDDHSVVFHPETMTVDMGYRGGVRTTWCYEVMENPWDTIDPTSWNAEYHARLQIQKRESSERGLFRKRPYEIDAPYDETPGDPEAAE